MQSRLNAVTALYLTERAASIRAALCDLSKIAEPRLADLIRIAQMHNLTVEDLRRAAANKSIT
jgi:hypothetical protein